MRFAKRLSATSGTRNSVKISLTSNSPMPNGTLENWISTELAASGPGTPRIPSAALFACTGRALGSAVGLPWGACTYWMKLSLRYATPIAIEIGPAQPLAMSPSAVNSQTSWSRLMTRFLSAVAE